MAIVFTAHDPHTNEAGPRVPLAEALASTLLRTAHGITVDPHLRAGTLDGERFWRHEVLQSRVEDASRIVHEGLESLGAWATLHRTTVRWSRVRDLGDRWCDDCLTHLAETEVIVHGPDTDAGWSLWLCATCRLGVDAHPERIGAVGITDHPAVARFQGRAT